jgi:site-specific recombinase XerD
MHTKNKSISIRCGMRKVLVMLDSILNEKAIPDRRISFVEPLKAHCREYVSAADIFGKCLFQRRSEENTIKFSIYCANHFFCAMEKQGVRRISEISAKHIAGYLLSERDTFENSTKRAMSYRLRQLFKCLHAKNLTAEDMSVYVSTDYVIRKKPVTVLPDQMHKALAERSGNFESVRSARDYAICMLALRLMLRKSDIFKLKVSDVDWKHKKISIVQKKNKIPLALPLTDDAGNALAIYMLDFRPKSEHQEIFLSVPLPHKPLKYASECLSRALADIGYDKGAKGYGLHLLRRTGASSLLRAGIPLDMISSMLGDQCVASAEPYLSADEKRMLQCCGDFGIPGFSEVAKWL